MLTYIEKTLIKKEILKGHSTFKFRVKRFSLANELAYNSNPSFYNYSTKQKRLDAITLLCRGFFIGKDETLSITKKTCNDNFGISENSITSIINTLSVKKSITISRKYHDRRELLIEPTNKGITEMFLFFMRVSYPRVKRSDYEDLVAIKSGNIYNKGLINVISNYSSHLVLGYSITSFVPLTKVFLERVGGRIIMFHLYNQIIGYHSSLYKTNCTRSSLYSKLKISRPQINRILSSAEENKLLSIDNSGHIFLNNSFVNLIDDYFAALMSLNQY